MVNNCVVQGYIVGTAKQNVTLRGFPKERAETLMPAAFRIGDSKPLRADASLPFVQAMLRFS